MAKSLELVGTAVYITFKCGGVDADDIPPFRHADPCRNGSECLGLKRQVKETRVVIRRRRI